jgi:plastocyanin
VARGDTVTFRNIDTAFHTVTAGIPGAPSGAFDSGDLFADQSFSVTFDKAGEFAFFCRHHPDMTGTIIVK